MKTISVNASRSYDIHIERGLLGNIGAATSRALGEPCRVAVLTDDTVAGLYGERVMRSLSDSGFSACMHAMKHGEINKNASSWAAMLDFLADNRLTRADCVMALGGGVVGDVAGFAAASYMRGIRLVQAPTTMLAMVDSSVGGKTGFNLAAGKNLAGAFYQPSAVLCDPDALDTLPPDTLADGIAEAVKYGVLGDTELFAALRSGAWRGRVEDVISRCVSMKAALVVADESDRGSRQLLNLGHTFGHAIERLSGYEVSHGHAVAIGMALAARLSLALGLCEDNVPESVTEALQANALPVETPFGAAELARAALMDKKREGERITLVLPRRVGECELYRADVSELERLMRLAEREPRA